jgi:hypothetical protein
MRNKYEEDIRYPYYIRQRPNGIALCDNLINTLINMKAPNLTFKCISCHNECGPWKMYCSGCFELLTKYIGPSSSFLN